MSAIVRGLAIFSLGKGGWSTPGDQRVSWCVIGRRTRVPRRRRGSRRRVNDKRVGRGWERRSYWWVSCWGEERDQEWRRVEVMRVRIHFRRGERDSGYGSWVMRKFWSDGGALFALLTEWYASALDLELWGYFRSRKAIFANPLA